MWIFRLSAESPHPLAASDFVAAACGPGCLFGEQAMACLRDLLAPDGELTPVACAAGTFYVYNCRRRLAHAAPPDGANAFRINTRGAQVFVSGAVAERILACGLTGSVLEPLWVEPGLLQVGCAPGDVARLAWESGIGYLQPFVAEHLAPAFRLRPAPGAVAVGALSFFGDRDRWAVHYTEDDAPAVSALHLDGEDQERYRTLVEAVAKGYGPGHQVLGHPAVYHDLPPLPGGWTLLLQLDASDTAGRLCFWAPTSNVAERHFDRLKLVAT